MNKAVTIYFYLFSFLLSNLVSSGGHLSRDQKAYNVSHYKIDLKVDPKKKIISGYVDITFKVIDYIEILEIDLIENYNVSKILINDISFPFKHENNKILVSIVNIEVGNKYICHIEYKGKPPIAKNPPWDGGVTWEKSNDGYPWVSVSCQSNGAHIWYPCKEHPSDKPDSADIYITIPRGLKVASNGLLQSKNKVNRSWEKWHWKTKYPIATYNINFTIGNFEHVERTSYLYKKPLKIVYYVLNQSSDKADELIDKAEIYLSFYSHLFGDYPWINEKFGIVQTPYLGMEHQTIIAYGNNYKLNDQGYDFLLFHEIGHEWLGNYLSVPDWADFWIHEGFTIYSEALYLEELIGYEAYINFFKNKLSKSIPLSGTIYPHKNASMVDVKGLNAYYKGAYVLHMIRYLVGKETLMIILKEFINMNKRLENNQVTTTDFIELVEKIHGQKLDWFFNVYIYEKNYPTLNKEITSDAMRDYVSFYWSNVDFIMPIDIDYISNTGLIKKRITITDKKITIPIVKNSLVNINQDNWVLFKLDKKQ
tara:strand:+ start:4444 stop:6051 length:1608 start_codon:yes stop_codon:yes gene_type:complete